MNPILFKFDVALIPWLTITSEVDAPVAKWLTSLAFIHLTVISVIMSRIGVCIAYKDIGDVYCFGTWLSILKCNDVCQCHHFTYTYKLRLLVFKISPKCEDIVHFYLAFL